MMKGKNTVILLALLSLLALPFMLPGCTTSTYVPCCAKENMASHTPAGEKDWHCILEDGFTDFGMCDQSTMKDGAINCTNTDFCAAADGDLDQCAKKALCTWNAASKTCNGGIQPMSICVDDVPKSCISGRCTAMMCGYRNMKPAPLPASQDWDAKQAEKDPRSAVGNYPIEEESGKDALYPVNLQKTSCAFKTMDRKLTNEVKASSGKIWVNSFRFGIGRSFADWEEARNYFPVSDVFCSANPLGHVDRFVNYVSDPENRCKPVLNGEYYNCNVNNMNFTGIEVCTSYCGKDAKNCIKMAGMKFGCDSDQAAYSDEVECRNSCMVVADAGQCAVREKQADSTYTSPFLTSFGQGEYVMKYVTDYFVNSRQTSGGGAKDSTCRLGIGFDLWNDDQMYSISWDEHEQCTDFYPWGTQDRTLFGCTGLQCRCDLAPCLQYNASNLIYDSTMAYDGYFDDQYWEGSLWIWASHGQPYWQGGQAGSGVAPHKQSVIDFDYEYYEQKLAEQYKNYNQDAMLPFECSSSNDCYSGACDYTHHKRGICYMREGTKYPDGKPMYTSDCGCYNGMLGGIDCTYETTFFDGTTGGLYWKDENGNLARTSALFKGDQAVYDETIGKEAYTYYLPLQDAMCVDQSIIDRMKSAETSGNDPMAVLAQNIGQPGAAELYAELVKQKFFFKCGIAPYKCESIGGSIIGYVYSFTPEGIEYYESMETNPVQAAKYQLGRCIIQEEKLSGEQLGWCAGCTYATMAVQKIDWPALTTYYYGSDNGYEPYGCYMWRGEYDYGPNALIGNAANANYRQGISYDRSSFDGSTYGAYANRKYRDASVDWVRKDLVINGQAGNKYDGTIERDSYDPEQMITYYQDTTYGCHDGWNKNNEWWTTYTTSQSGKERMPSPSAPYLGSKLTSYLQSNIMPILDVRSSGLENIDTEIGGKYGWRGTHYQPEAVCNQLGGDGSAIYVVGGTNKAFDHEYAAGPLADILYDNYFSTPAQNLAKPYSTGYTLYELAPLIYKANYMKEVCDNPPLVGISIDGKYTNAKEVTSKTNLDALIGNKDSPGILHKLFYDKGNDLLDYEWRVDNAKPKDEPNAIDLLMQEWYPTCDAPPGKASATQEERIDYEMGTRMNFSRALLSNFSKPSLIWKFHFDIPTPRSVTVPGYCTGGEHDISCEDIRCSLSCTHCGDVSGGGCVRRTDGGRDRCVDANVNQPWHGQITCSDYTTQGEVYNPSYRIGCENFANPLGYNDPYNPSAFAWGYLCTWHPPVTTSYKGICSPSDPDEAKCADFYSSAPGCDSVGTCEWIDNGHPWNSYCAAKSGTDGNFLCSEITDKDYCDELNVYSSCGWRNGKCVNAVAESCATENDIATCNSWEGCKWVGYINLCEAKDDGTADGYKFFMERLFNSTGKMVDAGIIGLVYDNWMTADGKGYNDVTETGKMLERTDYYNGAPLAGGTYFGTSMPDPAGTYGYGLSETNQRWDLTSNIDQYSGPLQELGTRNGVEGVWRTGTPFCALQNASNHILGIVKNTYGQKVVASEEECECVACTAMDISMGACNPLDTASDGKAKSWPNDVPAQLYCNDAYPCTMPKGRLDYSRYRCPNGCMNSRNCMKCEDYGAVNSVCKIENTGKIYMESKLFKDINENYWEFLAGLPPEDKCCLTDSINESGTIMTETYTYVGYPGSTQRSDFLQFPRNGEEGVDCGRMPDTSFLNYCNVQIKISNRQMSCWKS